MRRARGTQTSASLLSPWVWSISSPYHFLSFESDRPRPLTGPAWPGSSTSRREPTCPGSVDFEQQENRAGSHREPACLFAPRYSPDRAFRQKPQRVDKIVFMPFPFPMRIQDEMNHPNTNSSERKNMKRTASAVWQGN